MSAVIYRALDVESIVKIIETEGIQAIKGRPTCHSLIVLLNELGNGARNIKCKYSQFGMLWCVHPPNIYQILTGETVTAPPIPGLFPAYEETATSTQNTLIQIQWKKQKESCKRKIEPYVLRTTRRFVCRGPRTKSGVIPPPWTLPPTLNE